MKIGDWRTIGGPGVLPLQVENAHTYAKGGSAGGLNFTPSPMSASTGGILGIGGQVGAIATTPDENNNLWERPCMFGVRITNRDEDMSGLPIGAWIEDPETRGDIIGSTFWHRATRDVGFWRWSTPVVCGDEVQQFTDYAHKKTKNKPGEGESVATGGMAASGAHCKEQDKFHVGPVKKITDGDEWIQDKRVESISPVLPKDADGNKLWPKFPKEYFGIVLSADWEDEQQELFHPTDPRMIAVNRKGDAEMGSLVCDMDDDFKIDSERMARLQAFEWVIKKPTSEYVSFYGRNSIAWNIGQSGCADVRGGLIKDVDSNSLGVASGTSSGTGGGSVPGSDTGPLGLVSQRQSGPLEIPCHKHKVGKDEDGNTIFSTHLSMNSYFTFPGGVMDGPLKHDGAWSPPDEAPETAFVFFEYDSTLPHGFIGGTEYGKHRWRCQTNKYQPPQEPPPPWHPDIPTGGPPNVPGDTALPPDVPFDGFGGGQFGGGGASGSWPEPGGEEVEAPQDEWMPDFGWGPEGPLPVKPSTMPMVSEYLPEQGFVPFQYSSMEEGGISYIWRPQRFQRREGDWRKTKKPDRNYRKYTTDISTPITARLESWGAQGLRHADGDSPMDLATDWVYTHRPNSYRYLSGTADGGVCLLSPEVDLADIGNALDPLSGAAKSTTHFMAGRGTRFGAGLPDLFSGGIDRGYSWFDGTVGGQSGGLIFATNLQSTKTDRIFFEHNTGAVGINEVNPASLLHIHDNSLSTELSQVDMVTLESDLNRPLDSMSILFMANSINRGRIDAEISGVSTGDLVFDTKDTLAFRRHLLLEGDSGNVGINGQDFAGAEGAIFLANAGSLPTGTPSGGGILYVRLGGLYWRGSSGTNTLIASA